jgi:hydrogenase maturation protein HypF
VRVRVEGTVQGVGFRPFVYRLANDLGLAGHVRNDERGVLAEAEGDAAAVDRFLSGLADSAPPLAVVERVAAEDVALREERGFHIVASGRGGEPDALVSPDTATCGACLAELFDPADRRFRYPFINCTDCGPRLTIVTGVPYDRPLTTMAGWQMCEACRREYDEPRDRRFHAQPNACPECGPRVVLLGAAGAPLPAAPPPTPPDPLAAPSSSPRDPLAAAAAALLDGRIVAVKGVGGYHLACRADDESAVAALRARKHRDDKPFALMVRDLAAAGDLVVLGDDDRALLAAPERPIVIAPRRPAARVASAVAPGRPDLGVMLAYSPLHHLLLADAGVPLVMTSGNLTDEPIAYEDADARGRLAGIADLFVVGERPIHTRVDDSVLRATARGPLMVRRSRGYVPRPLALWTPRPLLACGAELKNTFCVARGGRAWVGHHIGDLSDYETLRSFRAGVEAFERLFAVRPEVVAHDLHPDMLSTRYALEREGVGHVAVQHHHAHLAACLAEHGDPGPAVGAIFDGFGLGDDGTAWGGELLVGGAAGYERAGWLWPAALPGGDRAAREPWRMACAWLVAAGDPEPALPRTLDGRVDRERWRAVASMARTGTAAPPTTSAGRLFDAVAALCGLRTVATYEGQAAAELEAACAEGEHGVYPLPVTPAAAPSAAHPGAGASGVAASGEGGSEPLVLDARPFVRAIVADADSGRPPGVIAARFHNGLAEATADALARIASARGLDRAVLSGGVFQNRRLLEAVAERLERAGLRVLTPVRLPPNDGGISYGQAAVAAARDA